MTYQDFSRSSFGSSWSTDMQRAHAARRFRWYSGTCNVRLGFRLVSKT